MKCPLVSLIFLKRSLVFPFCCFPVSLHWWLRKAFLSLLAILWNSAFRCLYLSFLLGFSLLFFSQLFISLPQTAILPFCISFPWGWSWSLSPVQCHEPHSIVHQALYLSDLGPIPKKGNAKECSHYCTIALISHASKVMLKILQARLQQYMNCELPDVQAHFRKGKGTRD